MIIMDTLLRELRHRVASLVLRGVITLVRDAAATQRVQIKGPGGEELSDDVEHLQPYGLSARPPVGSQALMLAVGGDREHSVAIIAFDPSARPRDLGDGDVALYELGGQALYLYSGAAKAHLQSPNIDLGGEAALLPQDGVLTGMTIDTLTGQTFYTLGGASGVVKAKKA